MSQEPKLSKLFPFLLTIGVIIFLITSFHKGKLLVEKTEQEIKPEQHEGEANAQKYELKEIDSVTGDLRWQLTAQKGNTKDNLQGVTINKIEVKVFKNNEVSFFLQAPAAKANALTKEILLFDGVITKNKDSSLILESNKLSIGMGTLLEALDGFSLVLKDSASLKGNRVKINEDQTKVIITDLKEAIFKDIQISGKEVQIEKTTLNNEITKFTIKDGGKVILKNNDTLTAKTIEWQDKTGIKANTDVRLKSGDKAIQANSLILMADNTVVAKDNIFIEHNDTKCTGNNLSYADSLIEISGNSKAIQGNKIISANKIIYDVKGDKLQAVGNVKTIMLPKR